MNPNVLTTKKTVLMIVAIFAVSLNMRPAITSIGPLLETIRAQLVLSNAQVSMLTALPVICMGVFASLAPVLNRRFGLNATMILMVAIIGVMTALREFIPTYTMLLVSSIGVGIAIAIAGPLLSAMIKQNFPHRAGPVIGIYSFGLGAGATVSTGLSAYLYELTGSYSFALSIWAVLAFVGIAAWLASGNDGLIVRQHGGSPSIEEMSEVRSPWKNGKAWLFLLFFGLQSAAFFSIVIWLAPIAMSKGMTMVQAGTLVSLMTAVQIVLNITIPLMMERYPGRKMWLLFILLIGLVAVVLFGTGHIPLLWVGALLMGVPLGGMFPIALVLPLDETENAAETNSWTAMMQTGGYIIGGILPLVIGVLYDTTENHQVTIALFGLLFLGMVFLAILIGDKKE
ncbi:MFS transporter [Sporosarcina gallistercoris]|uniref:MFS transporter n=1 Tax=Sporosarcina gallistercoris TaxID=2762245 RepID=A0ABR8PJD6_9BACL|nr:MFS transporter [Sporosarcina gallistercoris]MBD7908306.1 MFS transporter [Sporosarcina gallistercoris]